MWTLGLVWSREEYLVEVGSTYYIEQFRILKAISGWDEWMEWMYQGLLIHPEDLAVQKIQNVLGFMCCNAAVNAPGPIPSGPFPRQNPKSRDADRARFVKGSLLSFASC